MIRSFPLFQSHLDLAHSYWARILSIGDCAIDATCGNGRDTWKLCQFTLAPKTGKVYAFDVQEEATLSTMQFLNERLTADLKHQVSIQRRCHSDFPDEILPGTVKLIVYNLGYLPGGCKSKTTMRGTTLQSLMQGENLLQSGGMMSITCYPGHREGAEEQQAILDYASKLAPKDWNCCHHLFLNRKQSPALILLQKKN